jgi:hypothetical protein
MNYAVKMGSGAMAYIPNFIRHSKVVTGREPQDTQALR